MTRIFIESLTSGYLLSSSDGGGFEISPIAAVSNAHDLIRWLADHEGVNLDDLRPTGEPNFKQPTLVFDKPDCAGEPESIGEITERVVRNAGGEGKAKRPEPVDQVDLRDDERAVPEPSGLDDKPASVAADGPAPVKTVAIPCKPDGSDIQENLAEAVGLSQGAEKVMGFMAAVFAKNENKPIMFSLPVIAQKVGIKAEIVKDHLDTLARKGRLIADVRVKGHDPFYSLPVPDQFK